MESRPWHVRRMAERYGAHRVRIAYVVVNCAIAMIILSSIAVVTHEPFIFPSLGPTAFILFFAALEAQSAPRNVFCGQLLGVLIGYAALLIFGLASTGPDLQDITWARAGAVSVALAGTAGLMLLFRVPHAPATATTLIVALGLVHEPSHMAILMLGVVALIIEAFLINRFAGLPVPMWAPLPGATAPGEGELDPSASR